MCLDHPERVTKLALLDMLPTYHVFTNVNKNWAIGTWHWMFLAQPEPFPETLISAVPAEWFLRSRGGAGLASQPKPVFDEFVRCWTPKTIKGACHDYRANADIDFEMDAADRGRKIATPLLILWGTRGAPPTDEYPTRLAGICQQSSWPPSHSIRAITCIGTWPTRSMTASSDFLPCRATPGHPGAKAEKM